jgi:hypothetical protein
MGYTLEFWSLPLADVPGGDILQVADQVRAAGTLTGSIDHSSTGGEWFRNEFLGHLAAGLIGDQTAQHLLDRPIDGVTSTLDTAAYPALGWLSHEEITEALAHATHPATAGADSEDTDLLDTVLVALQRCTTDLVTIYS